VKCSLELPCKLSCSVVIPWIISPGIPYEITTECHEVSIENFTCSARGIRLGVNHDSYILQYRSVFRATVCDWSVTCSEDVSTGIAAQSEVVVMAVRAVRLVILARERTIHQRHLAVDTLETILMPVFVLVRQILYKPHITSLYQQRQLRLG